MHAPDHSGLWKQSTQRARRPATLGPGALGPGALALTALVLAALVLTAPMLTLHAAHAHAVLDPPRAPAGSHYKGSIRIGHGCDGAATWRVAVTLPRGFQGTRPQPKPGWDLSTRRVKLEEPYTSHGKRVTEEVVEIVWEARGRKQFLRDDHFDEFSFTARLPEQAGAVWIPVTQTCEVGEIQWSQVPASGDSPRGLKTPAARLQLF